MARGYVRAMLLFYEEKEARKEERAEIREIAPVFDLPEREFIANYKINPDIILYLCNELQEDLKPRCSNGLPVHIKVVTALKILVSGHYQRGNGQESPQCVGQTTVSKYLSQFVDAVNRRLKFQWINFPGTAQERQKTSDRFREKSGVNNILGAIDCTQIAIFPPPGLDKVQFLNRHRNMAINTQLICDADGHIMNVNANFPGRVHDQFIFNNSVIKQELKQLYDAGIGDYFLIGDSGYALEPWIMTPITNGTEAELRYTNWHCETRNIIERVNGYLKGTFRILGLDRRIHYAPDKASNMIYACCTLYNIMKEFRVPLTYATATAEEAIAAEEEAAAPIRGIHANMRLHSVAVQKRRRLIEEYFS